MTRRRVLLNNTINGYVKNGLVCYLDGLDKGGDDGNWHSLVSDDVAIPYMPDSTYTAPVADADCFIFNSKQFFTISPNPTGYVTREIVFKSDGTGGGLLSSPISNSTSTLINISGNKVYTSCWSSNKLGFNIPVSADGTGIISTWSKGGHSTEGLAMYNTVQCPLVNVGTYINEVTKGELFVGSNADWRYFFAGKIYAVRLYNRELTAEEMLHNQLNDIERFNLPVTPI